MRDFRQDTGLVAKATGPEDRWRKDVATAAALAWLQRIDQTAGYAALVAAVEDAILAGMAEGEADALASAAARQGAGGLDLAAAFTAACQRLAGDPGISQRALETIEAIIAGAAADLGRLLAEEAAEGDSEQDMTGSVRDTVTGVVRSVQAWLANNMWAALGAGVTGLLGLVSQGGGNALVNWENDGNPCAACQDNAAGSPYAPEDIPDFPAHPRCQCELSPAGDVPSSFLAAFLS